MLKLEAFQAHLAPALRSIAPSVGFDRCRPDVEALAEPDFDLVRVEIAHRRQFSDVASVGIGLKVLCSHVPSPCVGNALKVRHLIRTSTDACQTSSY